MNILPEARYERHYKEYSTDRENICQGKVKQGVGICESLVRNSLHILPLHE